VGGSVYDLSGLSLQGLDQYGASFEIGSQNIVWALSAGSTGASLDGSILSPTAAGSGQVTASIGSVISNPVDYTVSPAPPAVITVTRVINPTDITVPYGASLDSFKQKLPATVQATLSNDTTATVGVTWDTSSYNGNTAGTYTLTGTLTLPKGVTNPHGMAASVKVIVEAAQSPGGGGGGGVPAAAVPAVQTTTVNDITTNSAVLDGSITSSGGAVITGYGFLWGASPDSPGNTLQAGTDNHTGAFTATLGSLQPGAAYYFQAYARDANGLYKGNLEEFKTSGEILPPVPPPLFGDVPAGHWAHDAINDLNVRGYVYGYPDGTFRPDGNITRAEFVTILNRALKLHMYNPEAPDYRDIFSGNWFYSAVENGTHAGIVYGYGNDLFAPDKPITREEMACILIQTIGMANEARSKMDQRTGFIDDGSIAWWSRGFVAVAVEHGLIGYPDHTFKPKANVTRAEACAMVDKLLGANS
jgi:hypothetical protein